MWVRRSVRGGLDLPDCLFGPYISPKAIQTLQNFHLFFVGVSYDGRLSPEFIDDIVKLFTT